jgi:adenylate kinase family enzyme
MIGPMGAGKSTIAKQLVGGSGLRSLNLDNFNELLIKQGKVVGGNLTPDQLERSWQLTQSQKGNWVDERLGLLIDGSGRNVEGLVKPLFQLEELGYDTMIILVNVSLETSLQRQQARAAQQAQQYGTGRNVPTDLAKSSYEQIQQNIPKLKELYGNRLLIINNEGTVDLKREKTIVNRFLSTPPSKPAAIQWIKSHGSSQGKQLDNKLVQHKRQQAAAQRASTYTQKDVAGGLGEESSYVAEELNKKVIAHGYMYNRQDQRVAWTKEFVSEAEAKEWARRRNATLLSVVPKQELNEASGYIPTAAEADDPRFEMALSVDIHPGSLGKAANSFLLNTDSQGYPQELRPDGLVKRMTEELARFKIDGKLLESDDAELTEVKMSPDKLSSWAKKNGEGIRAGFEAELIFRDAHINTKSESKKGKFNIQIAKKLAKDLSKTLGVVTKVYSEPHEGERNDTDWIFEPDKSLKLDWLEDDDMPVEIITPPMPLSHTLEIMDKFFAWAKKNNARANELTGFHMSVSLPGMENEVTVDYVKLALFLGDEYILQQFAREGNRYTVSALSMLQNYAGDLGNMSALAMKAMKDFKQGLIKTAANILNSNNDYDKYTSINPHDNYIEFRSAGNQGYFSDIKKIQNTLTRYAYAMSIANDPNASKKEYIKKLYMLLTSTATVQQTDRKSVV